MIRENPSESDRPERVGNRSIPGFHEMLVRIAGGAGYRTIDPGKDAGTVRNRRLIPD